MKRHRTRQNPHRFRLRQASTQAERMLWRQLRHRFPSQRFRRQVTLGPYIVDFALLEPAVVIELDGSQHADNAADIVRDAWLADHGFRVLRFWNADVFQNLDGVLDEILTTIHPSP